MVVNTHCEELLVWSGDIVECTSNQHALSWCIPQKYLVIICSDVFLPFCHFHSVQWYTVFAVFFAVYFAIELCLRILPEGECKHGFVDSISWQT